MKYLQRKIGNVGVGILIIALIFVAFQFLKPKNYQFYTVEKSDFLKSVVAAGRVVPSSEVNLSFENSGQISSVLVNIGDKVQTGQILARLVNTDLSKEIEESVTVLDREQIILRDLIGENNKILSRQAELLSVLKKAHVTADDIVRSRVDIFFTNIGFGLPEFSNVLVDWFLRRQINQQRVEIENILKDWEEYNNSLLATNVSVSDVQYNINNLRKIEDFLNLIASGSANFQATNEVSRAQIDAYISNISNARNSVSALIVQLNQSSELLRSSKAEIPLQQSRIRNIEAIISRLNSRTGKLIITAPFDGIITARNIEPGQISEIGRTAISMIADTEFEIETFIPEIMIAGIDIGNEVRVKFDAFGRDRIFKGVVSQIDPIATQKDGITTYRTKINFVEFDSQIRSGMTVEVEIIKEFLAGQIVIPNHLVFIESGESFVSLLVNNKLEKRQITFGQNDGRGSVLVVDGLKIGDKIILPQSK
jgi:RND family efflux transporter MFP subunit